MIDIPLADAMLCWNSGFSGDKPGFKVVRHPDEAGHGDDYRSSVGACFAYWRDLGPAEQRLQLMIEAWQIAAFYDVPIELIREALLVIPEYRNMLATDCLPEHLRDGRTPGIFSY